MRLARVVLNWFFLLTVPVWAPIGIWFYFGFELLFGKSRTDKQFEDAFLRGKIWLTDIGE